MQAEECEISEVLDPASVTPAPSYCPKRVTGGRGEEVRPVNGLDT